MSDRKLRVFLCHASQDKSIVRELYERLSTKSWIDPWFDEKKLHPGQNWSMEIEQAVEAADAVIVCLSNASVNKEGYIQKEIKKILDISDEKPEGTIYVIPLRLEECGLPRRLAGWQYINYFPREHHEHAYQSVLTSLRDRAKSLDLDFWGFRPRELLFLPYSKKRYIDRGETSKVVETFRQEQQGERPRIGSIQIVRGERGSGKTWFAFHLHRSIFSEMPGVRSLYISLYPLPKVYMQTLIAKSEWSIDPIAQKPEAFCYELMIWLCNSFGIGHLSDFTLDDLQSVLIDGIQKYTRSKLLVLILDSIFETDWSYLEILEQRILAPLAEYTNIFFIGTGSGRSYPWKSPRLRFVIEEHYLTKFEKTDLASLLAIDKLLELSKGNPLIASYILWKSEEEPVIALERIIEFLLQTIPSYGYPELRFKLEAICVLDNFREEEMSGMLENYDRTNSVEWSDSRVRQLSHDFSGAGLLYWKEGGFHIDDTLQTAVKNYLQLTDMDRWIFLNSNALKMYQGFSYSYPKFNDYFENKVQYYREELEKHNFFKK